VQAFCREPIVRQNKGVSKYKLYCALTKSGQINALPRWKIDQKPSIVLVYRADDLTLRVVRHDLTKIRRRSGAGWGALGCKDFSPYIFLSEMRRSMSTLTVTAKGQATLSKDLLNHMGGSARRESCRGQASRRPN
jgi:hypothetical protein